VGALPTGVKRPGHKADHSPPSSAEIKNAWGYTSTSPHTFRLWYLVKHLYLLHSTHIMWTELVMNQKKVNKHYRIFGRKEDLFHDYRQKRTFSN
jgi:hypothetical protein